MSDIVRVAKVVVGTFIAPLLVAIAATTAYSDASSDATHPRGATPDAPSLRWESLTSTQFVVHLGTDGKDNDEEHERGHVGRRPDGCHCLLRVTAHITFEAIGLRILQRG